MWQIFVYCVPVMTLILAILRQINECEKPAKMRVLGLIFLGVKG